jgi:hypothetical protein
MVSLVDIVAQTRTVTTAAGDVELRGLGLRQIAELFLMFPNLRNLFTQGAPAISPLEIIMGAPEAIGTIVATCAGQPEAADRLIDVGSALTPGEMMECLEVIWNLTFPAGVSPFLDRAVPLIGFLLRQSDPADEDLGKAPVTSAPKEPSDSYQPDMLAAK